VYEFYTAAQWSDCLVEEIDVEISQKKGSRANNAGDGPRNGGMKRAALRKHKLSNDTFNMKKGCFESRPVYKHVWSRKACGNCFSNEECGVCYSSEECGECISDGYDSYISVDENENNLRPENEWNEEDDGEDDADFNANVEESQLDSIVRDIEVHKNLNLF
jgi:hypothetical protein